jgi:hypothetical protein
MTIDRKLQLTCAYSGYAFTLLFVVGFWVIAGFVPPPHPTESAIRIAAIYRTNHNAIQIAMALCVLSSALLLPWGAAVTAQMRRIERGNTALVYVWLLAVALLTIEFIYPCLWWEVAAFRFRSTPQVIQGFNDMGWLAFMGIISTAIVQSIALGVVILKDQRERPVFPRWFGYFQLWCAVLALPDAVVFMFHGGPLAWDGILSFWMVIAMAAIWLLLTTFMTARAIRDDREAPEDTIESRLGALERQFAAERATV